MQHHELKKYLEFTVNKKPENIKIFAHEIFEVVLSKIKSSEKKFFYDFKTWNDIISCVL